jgi:iron(III) transport system permease protein
VGFLCAYYVVRRPFRGAGAVDTLSILPIGLPAIVLSVGFLWAYLWFPLGIYATIWALMLALATVIIPHTVRNMDAGLRLPAGLTAAGVQAALEEISAEIMVDLSLTPAERQ